MTLSIFSHTCWPFIKYLYFVFYFTKRVLDFLKTRNIQPKFPQHCRMSLKFFIWPLCNTLSVNMCNFCIHSSLQASELCPSVCDCAYCRYEYSWSLWCMSRGWNHWAQGIQMFSFMRQCQTVPQSGGTDWQSHQQCIREQEGLNFLHTTTIINI